MKHNDTKLEMLEFDIASLTTKRHPNGCIITIRNGRSNEQLSLTMDKNRTIKVSYFNKVKNKRIQTFEKEFTLKALSKLLESSK